MYDIVPRLRIQTEEDVPYNCRKLNKEIIAVSSTKH